MVSFGFAQGRLAYQERNTEQQIRVTYPFAPNIVEGLLTVFTQSERST